MNHLMPRLATRNIGAAAAALSSYRAVSLDASVAGASPHQLIALLLERLLTQSRRALAVGEAVARLSAVERALAIVDGLELSLDDARGGSVATALHRAYAAIRERLFDGGEDALREAITIIEGLHDAWTQIAPRG